MKRAKYICFEGVDGIGKTTQVKMLAEYLESKGNRVFVTKETDLDEHGLSSIIKEHILSKDKGRNIDVIARELLLISMRVSHYLNVKEKILDKYDYVIQDRGALSGMAYASALGLSSYFIEGIDKTVAREINKSSSSEDRYISSLLDLYDLIVVLDTNNPSWAVNRARNSNSKHKGGDYIENLGFDFFVDVSRKMYTMSPHWKTKQIIVNKDETKEQVFRNIIDVIGKKI